MFRIQFREALKTLQFCPRDLQIQEDGVIFGIDGKNSFTAHVDDSQRILYGNLVAIASPENYVKRTAAGMVWVHDGRPTTLEDNLRNIRFTSGGEALIAIRKVADGEQLMRLGSPPDKSVPFRGPIPPSIRSIFHRTVRRWCSRRRERPGSTRPLVPLKPWSNTGLIPIPPTKSK